MSEFNTKQPENQAGTTPGNGRKLFDRGYGGIIPVIPPGASLSPTSKVREKDVGKVPGKRGPGGWYGFDWNTKEIYGQQEVAVWDQWGASIGSRMGGKTVGLDIDVLDPAVAIKIEDMLRSKALNAPVRTGLAPKTLRLFAVANASGPIKAKAIKRERPDKTGDAQGVEIIGIGKQAVLTGTHAGTGKPYVWTEADGTPLPDNLPPDVSELPSITEEGLNDLFDEIVRILEDAGYIEGGAARHSIAGTRQAANSTNAATGYYNTRYGMVARDEDREDVAKIFCGIPNDYDFRNDWVGFGMALRTALGTKGTPDPSGVWFDWCEKWVAWDGGDTAETGRVWNSMNNESWVGLGYILRTFDERAAKGEVTEQEAIAARERFETRHRARNLLEGFVFPMFDDAEYWDADHIERERQALNRLRRLAPGRYDELRVKWENPLDGVLSAGDTDRVVARGEAETATRVRDTERRARGVGLPSDFKTDFMFSDIPRTRDKALSYLAERYFLINVGGKAVVGSFKHHAVQEKGLMPQFMETPAFNKLTNRTVTWEVDDGNGGTEPKTGRAGREFLNWDSRPQFGDLGVWFSKTPPLGAMNLWQGWAVKPKPGDWSLIEKHMREVVCDRDALSYQFLLGWCAKTVQNPDQPGEVVPVLIGGEGTGKGVFGRLMVKLAGAQGFHVTDPEHLTGKFNAHLRNCVVLFADEAVFAGDARQNSKLKGILTEPTLTIEDKFIPATSVPNLLHVIMASNEEWVVPAGLDARRYFVLNVSDARKDDDAYFKALYAQINGDCTAAFLHHLLHLDLDAHCAVHGLDLRRPPKTKGLAEQKALSLEPHMKWWYSVLATGVLNDWQGDYSTTGPTAAWDKPWPDKIATKRLFDMYHEFCDLDSRGLRQRRLSESQFGKWLSNDLKLPGGKNARGPRLSHGLPVDEQHRHGGYELIRANKARCYWLPPLAYARTTFEGLLGQPIEWGDAEAESEQTDGSGETENSAIPHRSGFDELD